MMWSASAVLVMAALTLGRTAPRNILAYSTSYPNTSQVGIVDANRQLQFAIDKGTMPQWSPDGKRLAYLSDFGPLNALVVMDMYGGPTRYLTPDGSQALHLVWSPDGKHIAYEAVVGDNRDIYVVDACDTPACEPNPHNLTGDSRLDSNPSWSPNGRQIVFLSSRTGQIEIFVIDVDGSSIRQLTQDSHADLSAPQWSPDGQQIAFASSQGGNWDVYVMDAACPDQPPYCEGSLRNLSLNPAGDTQPTWSPDGKWIAFTSHRDGNNDIYLVSPDGSNLRNLTNNPAEDKAPMWLADGQSIAFESNRARLLGDDIFIIQVETGETRQVTQGYGTSQFPAR